MKQEVWKMIQNSQKNHNPASARVASGSHTMSAAAIANVADDNRLTRTRIRLQIPKNYHKEPVFSHLISDHGITVNITSAPSATNLRDDRWFSLELRGKARQIRNALAYLSEVNMLNAN